MEAGGKDSEEEEMLQMAFKKLRVDAESVPAGAVGGAVGVSEASRAAPRAGPEGGGGKTKLNCPKDNWHGCMRKSSRGASRSQRRRRSKSPILHPPKFTYCSSATLAPPGGCLKHQRLAAPEPDPRPAGDGSSGGGAQVEVRCTGAPSTLPPLVFGSCAGYETRVPGAVSSPPSLPEVTAGITTPLQRVGPCEDDGQEEGAPAAAPQGHADFRALSKLHGGSGVAEGAGGSSCICSRRSSSESRDESAAATATRRRCRANQQRWNGVEVYSFTGLRDVVSECESSQRNASRTPGSNAASSPAGALASGSPRSCSEQARGYVEDITIEDLSGYMEYYLYIPKKMSHMAEMMYT